MPRPIVATISSQALEHNLKQVRKLSAGSKIWSVVKADAYGHGLLRCWSSLRGTDGFAILNINDAIQLRNAGWSGPILLLEGFFSADEIHLIALYRLTVAIHSDWQLQALNDNKLVQPIEVYLKINTGMNRLGFAPEKTAAIWHSLNQHPQVASITLMSHFATADHSEGVISQLACFNQACHGLDGARSLANSAGLLWHPQTHQQWVRPGIILYGASPSGKFADIVQFGLKPVMTLASEIIAVQDLSAGDRVGYGGCYQAAFPHRIGIVACGYADGYPRHAQEGTPVAVDGTIARIVGRVSMDMLTVDLTPCPQAGVGSRVELWGDQIPIDSVALSAATLGYELMCAITPRVTMRLTTHDAVESNGD